MWWVLRQVIDALRYWVEVMQVDGFRFDLAASLAREGNQFEPYSAFFKSLFVTVVFSIGVSLPILIAPKFFVTLIFFNFQHFIDPILIKFDDFINRIYQEYFNLQYCDMEALFLITLPNNPAVASAFSIFLSENS